MKVKDLMTTEVTSVVPETRLKDVARILSELRISGVPVLGERLEVVGVVSEADILVKQRGAEAPRGGVLAWLLEAGPEAATKLEARTAGEAMTSPAITIGVEQQVSEAARLMIDHGVNRLPVVDRGGALAGIVTRADLVRAFTRPDADIAKEIRDEVVVRTLWIDDDDLGILVESGEVWLSGRLRRKSDAELLLRFASRVPGVVAVHSSLVWESEDSSALAQTDPRVPAAPRSR